LEYFIGFMVVYVNPILLAFLFADIVVLIKKIKNNESTFFYTLVGSIMFATLVWTFYLNNIPPH